MSESISGRKTRHLDICLDEFLPVETGRTDFDQLDFHHHCLPKADYTQIDLTTDFLGYNLKLPLMISCMTGGSDEGRNLNRILAQCAAEKGIAFGLGSIRVMLQHPERLADFTMRPLAPGIPILANIGASELAHYSPVQLAEALKQLEADALYVHLNAAQEIFQDNGSRDFRAWRENLLALIENADFPVLVKETGAGIAPLEGMELLRHGAAYIDLAGSGGTDWVAVECMRHEESQAEMINDLSFFGWGYPTAALLLAYSRISRRDDAKGAIFRNRFIASGGIRTAKQYALSLAGGAWLAASALPFIKKASAKGRYGVYKYIDSIEKGIRSAIVLSGATNLNNFRNSRLRVSRELHYTACALVNDFDILNESN